MSNGNYGMAIRTFDSTTSGATNGQVAVTFTGVAAGPVAGLAAGQPFRLSVFDLNDTDAPMLAPLGVVAGNGNPAPDSHRFMVAIAPPEGYRSVEAFATELLLGAALGLAEQGIDGPTVLVAFKHDDQLILVESWRDAATHTEFVQRVLASVAAAMGFSLDVLVPVSIDHSAVIVAGGVHEYIAGV